MAICCSCVATWLIVAAVGYFLYKKFFAGKKRVELRKKDWKKDVVYLFQFTRPHRMANYSPFCLKVEMFLRINKIEYENVFSTTDRSQYGLLPFIELNGVQTADSQLIIEILKNHFTIKSAPTDYEEGVARSVERFVDSHMFGLFVHYKLKPETHFFQNLIKILDIPLKSYILALSPILFPLFLKKVNKRVRSCVGGAFPEETLHNLLKKDLDALVKLLGDKKYLFGDELYAVDCAIFSHFATLLYLENPNEIKKLFNSEYPTLLKYTENIVSQVFPAEFA